MNNLTKRLSKLAKELTKNGGDYKDTFKQLKNLFYNATDEGKKNMIEQWDRDGL